MEKIRYFKLRNTDSGIVARIHVNYRAENEESWSTWDAGDHDIPVCQDKTVDLEDAKTTEEGQTKRIIPEGAHVRLIGFVVWGSDVTANEEYIYSKDAGKKASYKITGTTLNAHLTLESCE